MYNEITHSRRNREDQHPIYVIHPTTSCCMVKLLYFNSISAKNIEVARKQLQEIMKKYATCDIYNMNKTGLHYRMPPDKTLATKQMSGINCNKTQITLAMCANAYGSDIRSPLFLGHARQQQCFNKKDGTNLGFDYTYNKKKLMTSSVFKNDLITSIET